MTQSEVTSPMTQNPPGAAEDTGSRAGATPYVDLLGVRIHRVDMPTTISTIRAYVQSGEPHMVVTADSSSIVLAQTDEDFKDIVNTADLVTPDSSGILHGARSMGTPLLERVSGVDIAREVCSMSAADGYSVYFLGAAPGVAELAAQKLQQACPGLRVAGTQHGFFEPSEDAHVVSRIRESQARILLVAMGIPRQERWIRDHLSELGVCVAMGVGGSFDVFSGRVKRAPAWMQRHGLEWMYRLVMNPRKMRKVAALPRFMALVWRKKYLGGN